VSDTLTRVPGNTRGVFLSPKRVPDNPARVLSNQPRVLRLPRGGFLSPKRVSDNLTRAPGNQSRVLRLPVSVDEILVCVNMILVSGNESLV